LSIKTNIRDQVWYIKKLGISFIAKRVFYAIKMNLYPKNGKILKQSTFVSINTKSANKLHQAEFFIQNRESLNIPKERNSNLKNTAEDIFNGNYPYFQTSKYKINGEHKWHFNPHSHYTYPKTIHWSKIADFSSSEGDIKFVWEISRFCYLFDIIRYDHHFSKDSANFVFNEIEDWINSNPPELGPNYISGQEIAIRLLNWIYVMHFYSDSEILKTSFFSTLTNSIHLQAKLIDRKLYFSKTFVRNNHLLSESLALFTIGLLFPQFKESNTWLKKGHSIFCAEIMFQFDADGAYLQHSFNYQRVANQLCTWFLQLCNINQIEIEEIIKQRLLKSVDFMLTFIGNKSTGELPNFGNNDGSLIFPLNNVSHTNYYPQLQALASALNYRITEHQFEDQFWFNIRNEQNRWLENRLGIYNFDQEGYYVAREENCLTFLWCPYLKNRPAQADMLHVDIWYNGENILRDSGTYLYNTSDFFRKYFFGSSSHNTILYNGNDLMKKGKRFMFYFWPKKLSAQVRSEENTYIFTCKIHIFPNQKSSLSISRTLLKKKDKIEWEVKDVINNIEKKFWTQIWNISDSFLNEFNIVATDENQNVVEPNFITNYHSQDYGILIETKQLQFSTRTDSLKTIITKK
jgi:hypothetical protein